MNGVGEGGESVICEWGCRGSRSRKITLMDKPHIAQEFLKTLSGQRTKVHGVTTRTARELSRERGE